MKTRAKYLLAPAFIIILGLPQHGYPQKWTNLDGLAVLPLGDRNIADFMAIVPILKTAEPTKLCKPRITQMIDCGNNSSADWITNSYLIKIFKDQTPANEYASFFEGNTQIPLSKKYCSASSFSIQGINIKLVGAYKDVSYEVKVTGGKGGVKPISIEQYCTIPPPK